LDYIVVHNIMERPGVATDIGIDIVRHRNV
jgi:hypothetical protein